MSEPGASTVLVPSGILPAIVLLVVLVLGAARARRCSDGTADAQE